MSTSSSDSFAERLAAARKALKGDDYDVLAFAFDISRAEVARLGASNTTSSQGFGGYSPFSEFIAKNNIPPSVPIISYPG
jgi:hypothetical protein